MAMKIKIVSTLFQVFIGVMGSLSARLQNVFPYIGNVGKDTNGPNCGLHVQRSWLYFTSTSNFLTMLRNFSLLLIVICNSYVLEAQFNNAANILLDNGQYLQFKNSTGNAQAGVLHVSSGNEVFIGDIHNWLGGRVNIRTAGIDRISILPSGKVGIGTVDPSSTLHINAPLSGTSSMSFGVSNTTGNLNVPLLATTGGYNIDFYTWRDVRPDQIGGRIRAERINLYANNNALVQAMDLAFLTSDGSDVANLSEKLRIKYNGNVGIGTANPSYALEIYRATSQRIGMRVANDGSQTASIGLTAGRDWTMNALPSGASAVAFTIKDESFGAERLRIDQYGNVGIGTTDPKGYKLAVNGAAIFTKVQVKASATQWPDYVFHPTYELRSLSSLEDYINQHKHLPDVPSAMEIETNGNDLGATQAILLKKD